MDFQPYSRKATIVKISENRKIFLPFVKKWHQGLGQTSSIPNGVPWHRSYAFISICLLIISFSSWILGPQAEKGGNGTKQTRTRTNTCRQHRIQFKVKRDLKRVSGYDPPLELRLDETTEIHTQTHQASKARQHHLACITKHTETTNTRRHRGSS